MSWPPRRGTPICRLVLVMVSLYLMGLLYVSMPSSSSRGSVSLTDYVNIDDIIKGDWRKEPEPVRFLPSSCRPQNDLVFIKCMKCGTETLGTVFRRYAYLNNLSVVLPVAKRIYLGWPFPITNLDYRPSSRGYNLLMEHSIYDGAFMRRLMNPGAVFVTMIREPLDMFVSVLHYFNVFQLAGMTVKHDGLAVQTYLRNIHKYEETYKSHAASPKRYCIPDGFSVTRNLLSHCLGMPLGFPAGSRNITDDYPAVTHYIKELDREFLLVMIMEYFDESLVLLKRLLCWSIKDVLYYRTNVGAYHKNVSRPVLTRQDKDQHKRWSRLDYLLYDHFNRTFWRKVQGQGEDFYQEVAYFRHIHQQVMSFCRNVTPYGESYIRFPESLWSPPFVFSAAECRLMSTHLLNLLKERYTKQEPQYVNYTVHSVDRKFVPVC